MFHKRIDANQNIIVKALRQIGCSVHILSSVGNGCPDILVGHKGRNYLFEIKDGDKPPSSQKLTEHEENFIKSWEGQVRVVNCLEDCLDTLSL